MAVSLDVLRSVVKQVRKHLGEPSLVGVYQNRPARHVDCKLVATSLDYRPTGFHGALNDSRELDTLHA